MSNKLITYSLPESLIWKVDKLNRLYGVPKSRLIAQAILLLVSEYDSRVDNYGHQFGQDFSIEDVEKEYAMREE